MRSETTEQTASIHREVCKRHITDGFWSCLFVIFLTMNVVHLQVLLRTSPGSQNRTITIVAISREKNLNKKSFSLVSQSLGPFLFGHVCSLLPKCGSTCQSDYLEYLRCQTLFCICDATNSPENLSHTSKHEEHQTDFRSKREHVHLQKKTLPQK